MSFLVDLISDLTGVGVNYLTQNNNKDYSNYKYGTWFQDTEKKIQKIFKLCLNVMGNNDRVLFIQEQVRKLHFALGDLNPDLEIEEFMGDTRSPVGMQQTRILLLNLWQRLLLLLDKIEDSRTVVVFLESMHKIMIRSEFDTSHLMLNDVDIPTCDADYPPVFHRYRQLLFHTHIHVSSKLAESSPVPIMSPSLYGLDLIMVYSKIISVNFFRIPEVGYSIIECFSSATPPSFYLADYEERHDEEFYENKKKMKEEKRTRLKSGGNRKLNLPLPQIPSTPSPIHLPPPEGGLEKDPFFGELKTEILDQALLHGDIVLKDLESPHTIEQKILKPDIIDTPISEESQKFEIISYEATEKIDLLLSPESRLIIPKIEDTQSHMDDIKTSPSPIPADTAPYELKPPVPDTLAVDNFITTYTSLFGWNHFHSAFLLADYNTHVHGLNSSNGLLGSKELLGMGHFNKAWLHWISTDSIFFLFLFKDWIEYVQKVVEEHPNYKYTNKSNVHITYKNDLILWNTIPGYQQFLEVFLRILQEHPRLTPPLQSATQIVIHSEPQIINYFLRSILSRTQLYQMPQLSATLLKLQIWFQEFAQSNQPLPQNFDYPYLCSAFDAIISTDHHQLLQKVLQILYDMLDLFTGELRKTFISEFIFTKYFYTLFLHWDEVTRNFFQQLLLWKVVRIKQSQLGGVIAKDQLPYIGRNKKTNSWKLVDPEVELITDIAMLSKIQCYLQIVREQPKRSVESKSFNQSLEVYIQRALFEYDFFYAKYKAWQTSDKEWRLMPLALLDVKRRASFLANESVGKS
eukprot:TRINITY_DN18676_c0_g5_i1.p1 TRINITY_DN18676_c0_g5~~TRINITY_DN18676_c0_g5_i1.p1  ORF type:complete len:801 (+),score=132.47 TRINITY_DN18676_c0_g5_i1:86-2488(+)